MTSRPARCAQRTAIQGISGCFFGRQELPYNPDYAIVVADNNLPVRRAKKAHFCKIFMGAPLSDSRERRLPGKEKNFYASGSTLHIAAFTNLLCKQGNQTFILMKASRRVAWLSYHIS